MTNTLKTLFFIAAFFAVSFSQAQIKTYSSYEAFQNKEGESFDDYKGSFQVTGSRFYSFIKDGKKVNVAAKKMWGFSFKNSLFRVLPKTGSIVKVINVGKIVYYENGIAHMDIMLQNYTEAYVDYGFFCYMSENLNSEIIPVADYSMSPARKAMKEFAKTHPETQPFFDCVKDKSATEDIRKCVTQFEGKLEE